MASLGLMSMSEGSVGPTWGVVWCGLQELFKSIEDYEKTLDV